MDEFTTMTAARQAYYNVMQEMQSGTYKGSGDIIDWTLWDRFDLAVAVLTHRLFVNGLGSGVGAQRTLADTNVVGATGIPQGQRLFVRAIKTFYQGEQTLAAANILLMYRMFQETTLNISIPGKDSYGQWALDELLGLSIQTVLTPAVAGDNERVLTESGARGILPLNLPIVLSALVSFSVVVVHQVAAATELDDDKIKIGLTGILERLA